MLPNVTITPAAEKFMRRFVRFSGLPAGAGFRLTVSAGGCSGFNSEFTVEPAAKPGDAAIDVNGLALLLPAESRLLLDGVTIDVLDTPTHSGLAFIDPKAGACACSSSAEGTTAASTAGPTKISISAIKPMAPRPALT